MPLMSGPSDETSDGVRVWHFDGNTAVRHDALLRIEGGQVIVTAPTLATAPMPLADLIPLDKHGSEPEFGLKHRPGWRVGLIEPPPPALAALLPKARRYGGPIDRIGLWPAVATFGMIATLLLVGLAQAPTLVAKLVPASFERRIGDLMVGDLGGRFCNGPGGQAALDALSRRLGVNSAEIDIRVANVPVVNAVTLPGGKIIIFDGLIKDARSSDELAGVIGHEIGHVEHRDVLASLLRQLGLSVLLGGLDGNIGGYTNALLGATYSRETERQADGYAIDLLAKSAVSPVPTAGFFTRLGGEEKGKATTATTLLGYLSSHPVSATRAERFLKAKKDDGAYRPALDSAEWQALRKICSSDKAASSTTFQF